MLGVIRLGSFGANHHHNDCFMLGGRCTLWPDFDEYLQNDLLIPKILWSILITCLPLRQRASQAETSSIASQERNSINANMSVSGDYNGSQWG